MYCKSCGGKLPEAAARYCPHCGTEQEIPVGPQKKKPVLMWIKIITVLILSIFVLGMLFIAGVMIAIGVQETDSTILVGAGVVLALALGALLGIGKITGEMKQTFKIAGIVIGGIAVIALVVVLFSGMSHSGITGLITLTVICAAGYVFLFGIGRATKSKPMMIASIVYAIGHVLIFMGALQDEPYVIRHIQGKDFVGIWCLYAVVVAVGVFILKELIALAYFRLNRKKAWNKIYSDSDLMLLQGFSRYQITGYFMLKAKLHNIIKYTVIQPTEESKGRFLVDINEEMPKEQREAYCKENPQVGKIVAFIEAHKEAAKREELPEEAQIQVVDVIYNLRLNPLIQSDGGRFARRCIERMEKLSEVFYWIGAGLGVLSEYHQADDGHL